MLSVTPQYVRLAVPKSEPFENVIESVRALFQICRLNNFAAAIVVSEQDLFDWRSCMRLAIRFSASRGPLPDLRLALVVRSADAVHRDVEIVAKEFGLNCRIFTAEPEALGWILGK